jgi:tRNA 2-thiouridine synthesizing protein A
VRVQESLAHPPAAATLDARGLRCPEPLMLVRNRLRSMAPGDVLCVVATDPTTRRDFADLCRFMGHTLEGSEERDGELRYWIRRAGRKP